jgi:trigger factor|tara:strand:+ start:205 stop:1602 length:1398 start_codon:yes stop_codon:yes gene_type:complete
MDIKQDKIDDLNAVISITITPEDYQEKVNTVLKDYRAKANLPGFRKGKVPFGVVKKMYIEGVMAEEVNKMLVDSLYKYIETEKLQVLGNPIPGKDEEIRESLAEGESFEFKYDIGISPKLEIGLSNKFKMDYYKIKVDVALVTKYTKDLTRRYGSIKEVEIVGESDMVNAAMSELDGNGNKVEGGIHSHASIALEYLEKATSKKSLLGKGLEAKLVVDPRDYSKGDADLAAMLHVDKKDLNSIGKQFELVIKKIHQVTPCEINQEFFDKLFGPGTVKTEDEFKTRLAEDLEKTLESDSDKLLVKHLFEKLNEKHKITLPQDFLKRWLALSNKDVAAEEIEKDFDGFIENMKRQLIENQVINETEIKVEFADALERTKSLFAQQMSQYGSEVTEDDIESAAKNYLSKNEESRQIYEQLMQEKLLNVYKETLNLKTKEVSFDDFVKLATGNNPKKGILDSLSNLVKM